jgi:tetratricopeptide (TPR) repeat protein
MRKTRSSGIRVFLAAGILVFLAICLVSGLLIYRWPPIYNRISWRLERWQVYVRGWIDPIQPMPTPLPAAQRQDELLASASPTPTIAPTLQPTASITATLSLTPTATPLPPLPASVTLPPPAWEKQDINNCGPAAMTMYLRFYGWSGNQQDIAAVVKPQRDDRNVNVDELAYFVRNNAGWLDVQYRVGGDLELLKRLLAAGYPVMIEESFFFDEPYWPDDDLWAAHYLLITGYDEAAGVFIGQDSFHGADQKIPYKKLDSFWQAFNRVYVVAYPTGQEAQIQAILGADWDVDANRQHGLDTALAETKADPKNALAWFNAGANYTYFEKYIDATAAFDKARELGLPQRMLRYQFAPFIAYFNSGQTDELMSLTEYALKVTPNSEEALLWRGWALYRQGDKAGAIASFQKALLENSTYQDARYALDFLGASPIPPTETR